MATKVSDAPKARNKSAVYAEISSATGLSKKQVSGVFDAMTLLVKKDLGKKGPGLFVVPGLMKVMVVRKPATKGGMRPNPFKPGEMMEVKPRPARNVVKVRPLKGLKEMV
jgi:hypothetical protein